MDFNALTVIISALVGLIGGTVPVAVSALKARSDAKRADAKLMQNGDRASRADEFQRMCALLDELQEDRGQLRGEMNDLAESIEQQKKVNDDLRAELLSVRLENATLRQRIEALEQENERMAAEIDALQAQNRALEQENQALRERIRELRTDLDRRKAD